MKFPFQNIDTESFVKEKRTYFPKGKIYALQLCLNVYSITSSPESNISIFETKEKNVFK